MTKDVFRIKLRQTERRYLALWLPFLSAERLRSQSHRNSAELASRPLVLVEKTKGALRLVSTDRKGAQLGLTRGLTLADARARIPELAVEQADPVADGGFLADLAALCDRYTPLVVIDPPDGLTLDITGCAHLFCGEARLRKALCKQLQRIGLTVRATIASTPDLARALARHDNVAIASFSEGEFLARRLPVSALQLPGEVTMALSRAGLKTLGDLANRSSTELAARFGEAMVGRLMRTLGREDARIHPLRPAPACVVGRHFPEPLTRTESIEKTLALLIGKAADIMEKQGKGGRVFEASLFHTNGASRRLVVETSHPTRDAKAILRLYQERLGSVSDPLDPDFGFDVIRFSALILEPMPPAQHDLDGHTANKQEAADLIDRLAARFGSDRVLRFKVRDTHDPSREAALIPANAPADPPVYEKTKGFVWRKTNAGDPPARPIQLFDPPQAIEALAEVPDGPPLRFRWRRALHKVARAEGPERIAPEWWRDGSMSVRDYYRLEDMEGRRFWVFRQGLFGQPDGPSWFLHGLFA